MSRSLTATLTVAAICVAAAPVFAGDAPPTVGVLEKMEDGDRSCYLHLRTKGSTVEIVHADFDLCNDEFLIGARVAVTYEPTNVIAASCEGDPECQHTERVMLAVSIERTSD